jgi:hypothetical protein
MFRLTVLALCGATVAWCGTANAEISDGVVRILDLKQVDRVYSATVRSDCNITEQRILDRDFLHLWHCQLGVVRSSRSHRSQIGQAKYPYDYYKLLDTIPTEQAFRPILEGNCPLVPGATK